VSIVHVTCTLRDATAQSRKSGGRTQKRQEEPEILLGRGTDGLPPAVAEMRAAIIAAVETGDIAELKAPIELNELKPEFGAPQGAEWLAHLRSISSDGTGKDVLAKIGSLLEGGWAAVRAGRDIENSRIYVWPHFAEIKLDAMTPDQVTELETLAGKDDAARMIAERRYVGWRLSIGADGVWHMLTQVKS
jgi:hypothetical protein